MASQVAPSMPITPQSTASAPGPSPGGYPKLAALVNSSPTRFFQVYRRFGTLNARCLLYLQDELCELEDLLAQCDSTPHANGSRRYDQHPDRGGLINHITNRLTDYNALLASNAQVLALPAASKNQCKTFLDWLSIANPVVQEETGFAQYPHDLVSIGGPQKDWMYRAMESAHTFVFSEKDAYKPPELAEEAPLLLMTSQEKLRRTIRVLVVVFGLLCLLTPILIIYFVKSTGGRLAVICGSITVFGGIVAATTPATNTELIASIAAYAAVVVVFLGSL